MRIKYYTPLEIVLDPVYVCGMSHSHSHDHHGHQHGHGHHAHEHPAHGHHPHEHGPLAAAPTFSLLRLSVWQRLAGAALLLSVLWLMILRVMG